MIFFCTHIYAKEQHECLCILFMFWHSELTCTEPCLSAGVRLPSVAPGLGTSGHAATPPLAFV